MRPSASLTWTEIFGQQLQSGFGAHLGQNAGGLLPDLVGADELVRILGGQLQVEVGQAVIAQQIEHEPQQRPQLVAHLVTGAGKQARAESGQP